MRVFFDTSAFAKRYVAEQGSDKVNELCQQTDSLVVSVICLPEFISALARLLREKRLTQAHYKKLKSHAIDDLADIDMCEITQGVLTTAIAILESQKLRAMDALHLACALAAEPDVFASADYRQLAAARNIGLHVIDVS